MKTKNWAFLCVVVMFLFNLFVVDVWGISRGFFTIGTGILFIMFSVIQGEIREVDKNE